MGRHAACEWTGSGDVQLSCLLNWFSTAKAALLMRLLYVIILIHLFFSFSTWDSDQAVNLSSACPCLAKWFCNCDYCRLIVALKVHVEIAHYKGPQGSNMRPCESFLWVRESNSVLGERSSERKILTWDPRERWTRGSRKIRKSYFLFAKNGRLQVKEFRSTARCVLLAGSFLMLCFVCVCLWPLLACPISLR